EDGIRDDLVTGVQTCALPIYSLTHLVKALSQQGHRIKRTALANLLHEQGYSLKVNKKTMEGTSHADRDEQFGHINALCQQFEQRSEERRVGKACRSQQ